ncbi:MAG TPA: CapA family protein [Candidatus Paceibacterota bacterium]|nr:CapA family protein [Candidatus Paceibacterota bacterium]
MRLFKTSLSFLITGIIIFSFFVFWSYFNTPHNFSVISNVPTTTTTTEPQEVSLLTLGDIMLSRGVAYKISKHTPEYPFIKVKDTLWKSDLVFGNLEGPIIEGREIANGEMVFRMDPNLVSVLSDNNIGILSLANNHIPNFGEEGIKSTITKLGYQNIHTVGAGQGEDAYKATIVNVKGIKIAFLAYSDPMTTQSGYAAAEDHYGIAQMDSSRLKSDIAVAKESADLVVIYMHSGEEYETNPTSRQINFAHMAIDNGADLVIGSHAHVVQSVEKYQNKYIVYGLGNFIFDQMFSLPTRQGVMAKFILTKAGVKSVEFLPYLINDYCQPTPVEGNDANKILKLLKLALPQK